MMQVQSCKLPGTAPTACTEKARSPHAFSAQNPRKTQDPHSHVPRGMRTWHFRGKSTKPTTRV